MRFFLAGLVGFCTLLAQTCHAESYVVLLKNPFGGEEHVHVQNTEGTFGINDPGYGTPIRKRIETVRRYKQSQIDADFSQALGSLKAILDAGLPPLPHSYMALMEMPKKPVGKMVFSNDSGNVFLERAGEAVLIDGYSDLPYAADIQALRNDFGPAIESLDEIIKAGFHTSYIVLLENPDGSVGKVVFKDRAGNTVLEEKGAAVDMAPYDENNISFKADEKQVARDFGNALESRPRLPVKYVLLFKPGNAKVADESNEALRKLLEDVKSRPAADITIRGHTDTVGRDAYNDKLSRQRAERVAELIRTQAVEPRAMGIEYFGKRNPAIETPDNTPELRNRRVEITVR